MNNKIIVASLDQSLLAMGELENGGDPEVAIARAEIATALATVAAAEMSIKHIKSLVPVRNNPVNMTVADMWIQEIEMLSGGDGEQLLADMAASAPEQLPPPPPMVIYEPIEPPQRGPGRRNGK